MREQTPDNQGPAQDDDEVSMDGLEGDVAPKPKKKRKTKGKGSPKASQKPPPKLLDGAPKVRFPLNIYLKSIPTSRQVLRKVSCLTCAPMGIICGDTASKGPRDSCDFCYLDHRDCKPGPGCPLTAQKLAARKRKAEGSPTPSSVPETTRKRMRTASQQAVEATPESEEAIDVPSTSDPAVKPKGKKGGKKSDEKPVDLKAEKVPTKPGKPNTSAASTRAKRSSTATSSKSAAAAPASPTKSTKAASLVAPSTPTKTNKTVPPVTPTKLTRSGTAGTPDKIGTASASGTGTRQVFECVLIKSPSRGHSSQFNAFRPTSRDTVTLGSLATRLDNVEATMRANSASNVNVVKEIREALKKIGETTTRDANAYQQQRLVMRAVAAALRAIQTTNNSPELDALAKALEDEPGGGSDDNGEVAGPSS